MAVTSVARRACLLARPLKTTPASRSIPAQRLISTTSIRRADAEPGRSSLGTPSPKPSDSADEGTIKSKRSMDGKTSPDTASLAEPVSTGKGAQGQTEEGDHPVHQDPKKPAGEKRKAAEQAGERPLDAADK